METESAQIRVFIREMACAVAALLIVCAVVLLISRNPDAYGSANIIKIQRLSTAASPRVVFIGGSGLAFGLDSARIEGSTGLHPVNLGLYAGFGIDYLLAQAEHGLRSGDIVVLVPEYDILTSPPAANGFLVLEAAQAQPSSLRFALSNTASVMAIARAFPTWMSTRVVSLAGRALSPFIGPSDTLYHRVYRADMFTPEGDNIGAESETYRLPAAEVAANPAGVLLSALDHRTIGRIEDFVKRSDARGIRTYITFPPVPRSLEKEAHRNLVISEDYIRSRFNDRVLGAQEDFVFEDDAFFDTVNHLGPEAKRTRSETLARLLEERLR